MGKTYFSEMFECEARPTEKAVLNIGKSIYLYTKLDNVILKVDVWLLEAERSKAGFEVMAKRSFLGALTIDISHFHDSGRTQKQLNKN